MNNTDLEAVNIDRFLEEVTQMNNHEGAVEKQHKERLEKFTDIAVKVGRIGDEISTQDLKEKTKRAIKGYGLSFDLNALILYKDVYPLNMRNLEETGAHRKLMELVQKAKELQEKEDSVSSIGESSGYRGVQEKLLKQWIMMRKKILPLPKV